MAVSLQHAEGRASDDLGGNKNNIKKMWMH